ncbi:MAG: ATP-binding response regulator [Gammaproteobacteria bacterium]
MLDSWGEAEKYGLEDLQVGDNVSAAIPFVSGYDLKDCVELPFISDASGRTFHVHLIPDDDSRFILFLDATDEIRERERYQQTANEVRLLLEKERRLMAELVDAQAELAVRRKEAEDESRRRGEYIATMSHEFRTPLAAVLAHAERLSVDSAVADVDSKQIGRAIQRVTQQLVWLVDNLLTRARLEADGYAVYRSVTDTRALVDDLCLVFAPLAADKELSFSARVTEDVPEFVMLDELHFRQVLVNLLGNAIKYTYDGSVELEIGYTGERLRADVADTGPGLSEEERTALFTPFNRGREEPRAPGAGLGLGITRQLVEAMSGKLTIDSEPGSGTRITVELDAPPAQELTDGVDSHAADLIVVGEDDPDISDLLEIRLTEAGYRVHCVGDGNALVEAALELDPSLTIVDVNMPGLDGPAAARKLRESGFDAPILALSGASRRRDIEYALASGCTDFLRKPPHLGTLKRLVHQLILSGRTGEADCPDPMPTSKQM